VVALSTPGRLCDAFISTRWLRHWVFLESQPPRALGIDVRIPKNADLQVDSGDGAVERQPCEAVRIDPTGTGSVRVQAVDG